MKTGPLKLLACSAARHPWLLAFCGAGAIIYTASVITGPLLIGRAVDCMAAQNEVNFKELGSYLSVLALIYAAGAVFNVLLNDCSGRIAYRTVNGLRGRLFSKLNTLPLAFFDRTPHGDTVNRFIADMDAISEGLQQGLSTLFTSVFTIAGAIYFMTSIHPALMVVVLLSAPLSFFTARFIVRRSQRLFEEQARITGELGGYTEEVVTGLRTVQLYGSVHRFTDRYDRINQKLHDVGMRAVFYSSMANPSARIVNNITYAAVGILGGLAALSGTITVGELSSFLIYSSLFSKPFNEITAVTAQIQAATAGVGRVLQMLGRESEPDGGDKQEIQRNAEIVFDHVSFSYDPEKPLIRNFNLRVEPGTRVAIVGRTGAGKTTIVNLLLRFYEPQSGRILLGGRDIGTIDRDTLRSYFGMVLQDTWLFEGTLRDNIAYGSPDATDEEIIGAAKSAYAHGFIRRLPDGYRTKLSEAGENISTGQKQLLSVARVMLCDPPALILDEATSSIDSLTEIHIQKAFRKMTEGRTCFVIAHRLSTIQDSDLILYIENGNITESGTHEELMRRGEGYAKLYAGML